MWLGKVKNKAFQNIQEDYLKRLTHYSKCTVQELKEPRVKQKNTEETTKLEAEVFLSNIQSSDFVILLDEKGKQLSSESLAEWLQHKMNISLNRLVFVIGGAYGAHQLLKDRADYILALSKMTLTHDMARMLLLEQVYRAYTILRGEKYHNS